MQRVLQILNIQKSGASSRWSFCPNSAWGGIEMTIIVKMHPTLLKLRDRVHRCLDLVELSAQSYKYIIRLLKTNRYVLGNNIDISDITLVEPYFTHIRNLTRIRGMNLPMICRRSWKFKIGIFIWLYFFSIKLWLYLIVSDRLSDKRKITWIIISNFNRKLMLEPYNMVHISWE